MPRIICQMYGLRHEIEKDPYTCFSKIKKIGFDAIQLDGMRGQKTSVIQDAIKQAGLIVASMHIKHNRFIQDVQGIIEEARQFQCNEVYLKYIDDEYQVEYGYKFTKYAFDKAVEILTKEGIHVGFHSPEYDFNTLVDGKKVMDFICEQTSDTQILVEPDTYWLCVAGVDPLSYLKQYPSRIQTIHLKDIDTSLDLMDMSKNLRPCGKGTIDFASILRWGEKNGIQNYAIEQDFSNGDIYEDMEASFQYIRALKNG